MIDTVGTRKDYRILVFLAAFCCLVFELIISRLADFHLDSRNSYIAIPITFLGLALGSLHVHFRRKLVERFRGDASLTLLSVVSLVALTLALVIFGQYLTVTGAASMLGVLTQSLRKTLFFVLVFVVPFYVFGRILTTCYYLERERIGGLYGADLLGASLGCLVTPFLFHAFSLPGVLTAFAAVLSVLVAVFMDRRSRFYFPRLLLLFLLNAVFVYIAVRADDTADFRSIFVAEGNPKVEELAHGWNEFSRVSLIKSTDSYNQVRYKIIHDNAQSNVNVGPYVPGDFRQARQPRSIEAIFLLGRPVRSVLDMFAGCGTQMLPFHVFSQGQAQIVGVELNGLVKDIATNTPELANLRLKEFYALPNIDLRIAEGRSFLATERRKFDVVFVGSKAATNTQLTGHTRKYLDTVEAYDLYLDRLEDKGILYFNHQPLDDVVATLKLVFAKRGLPALEDSAIAIAVPTGVDLMVAPSGFSREEVQVLVDNDSKTRPSIIYAPYQGPYAGRVPSMITSQPDPAYRAITDDRPYFYAPDWSLYKPFPTLAELQNGSFYYNYTRLTTLFVLLLFSGAFIVAACLRKEGRPPVAAIGYLLVTGFCYLLVEVTLMARLELLLQDLLTSMATTLTVFLMASAAGSALCRRFERWLDMRFYPVLVAAIVFLTMGGIQLSIEHLLVCPLWVRILVAVGLTTPIGFCAGVFYPYLVGRLVSAGRENAVPITYGISTLSSVAGASYAMTVMMATGFNAMLRQAMIGYLILALLVVATSFTTSRKLFLS